MQRREQQSSRHRRTNRDFRRFLVADLPDHADVEILPHQRTDAPCKGHLRFGVHLDLIDAGQEILDGIFDGHNVFLCRIQFAQGGIKGRSLA